MAARLSTAFLTALCADPTTRALQARRAGFVQVGQLSTIVRHPHQVPDGPVTRMRLARLARAIDFPVDAIYEDGQ